MDNFIEFFTDGANKAALAQTLLLSNVFWMFTVAYVYLKKQKAGAMKMTDQDWQQALDDADANLKLKEGGGPVHSEEEEMQVPYSAYTRYPKEDMVTRSREYYQLLNARRTVRDYSSEKFPISVLQDCIRAAGTAPSGANLQPWTYVIVENQKVKSQIRQIVEDEEAINYARRMKDAWKSDLAHLGTNSSKPYLEEAPYLVCVFKHAYRMEDGEKLQVYYPAESVGISVGMFQSAIHNVGLCTLTSTPMGAESALRELLDRPDNERLFLLMPVGYPKEDVMVPNITRKPLDEISAVV